MMGTDAGHMTEQILNLTLEFIYLLTGEKCAVVKMAAMETLVRGMYPPLSGSGSPSKVPPTSEQDNQQKILEVTCKMIELLTGEVSGCHQLPPLTGEKELPHRVTTMEGRQLLPIMRNLPDTPTLRQSIQPRENLCEYEARVAQKAMMTDELYIKEEILPDTDGRQTGWNMEELLVTSARCKTEDEGMKADASEGKPGASWEDDTGGRTMCREIETQDEQHAGWNMEEYLVTSARCRAEDDHTRPDTPEGISVAAHLHCAGLSSAALSRDEPSPERSPLLFPPDGPHTGWNVEEHPVASARSKTDDRDMKAQTSEGISVAPHLHCAGLSSAAPAHAGHLPERFPLLFSPDGPHMGWNVAERPVTSARSKTDDKDMKAQTSEGISVAPHRCADLSYDAPEHSPRPISHRVSQRPSKSFPCAVCGKVYRSARNRSSHQRSHTGKKPHSCPECGKSFAYKSKLTEHEAVHTMVKPFSCSECGKRFAQKSNLIVHRKSHREVKQYSCPECGKRFYCSSQLAKHHRVHTMDKPYFCSECGKGFTRKGELTRHGRVHMAEKPYPCSECGKSFSQKSNLLIHHRTHTGEKPYVCSECGKRFSHKRGLIYHEESHTREATVK